MRISGSFTGAEKFEIEAVDKEVIADAIPAYPTPFEVRLKERGLKLADHLFPHESDLEIDLLIGADLYWRIVGPEL
jgi:hypothetical protein